MVGCNSSNSQDVKKNEPVISATTGIWYAEAYGMVFDVKDNTHTSYQVSSDYCQISKLDEFLGYSHQDFLKGITVAEDNKTIVTDIGGWKIPGMSARKLSVLPQHCINDLILQKGDENYRFNPEQEFEIFWQTFNELYAFFELENVDWTEIYQIAASQINTQTTEEEFFDIAVEMIAPLKDFHVDLKNDDLGRNFIVQRKASLFSVIESEYFSLHKLTPPYSEAEYEGLDFYANEVKDQVFETINSQLKGAVKKNSTGKIIWGHTKEGHGYLNLMTMDLNTISDGNLTYAGKLANLKATLDAVVADFSAVKGLIIDVRFNGGGDDFVSRYIISRLLDKELHAYDKQVKLGAKRTVIKSVFIPASQGGHYTGPIAVLTSRDTSSAAETFIMSMRERENTILVGESSAGGFSDTLPKSLPHGLLYTLSNEFYLTTSGKSYEGVGVQVDIEKPFFTNALRIQGIDEGFKAASVWLTAQE
jgi:hypothetical protein